ncbi:hypothetical protein [Anaeromicrobium sediminis]|uniref:Uncharacterized protein n=1 Tax=Anaeromicrobium sediminis TaxID=1478221 RepID=A0A267MQ27_9FIRM|nr:hypothetical protein [Anaeromicrobium sediminis]PAB61005.1 hypothetical protein CCE28_00815 [Anaeromicrobium sediminis]
MKNSYSISVGELFANNVDEEKFLTILADAEKHLKEVLNENNLICPYCNLIIGNDFKIGVRIPIISKENPILTFFAVHSFCIENELRGLCEINENGELETTALNFLGMEDSVKEYQKELLKCLDMLEKEEINGQWKVFLRYDKAGKVSREIMTEAAKTRFKEIQDKGSSIICPTCSKEVKQINRCQLLFITNGKGKDANVELIHKSCESKFMKNMKRRGFNEFIHRT